MFDQSFLHHFTRKYCRTIVPLVAYCQKANLSSLEFQVNLSNDSLVYEIMDAHSVNCPYYRGVITVTQNPDDAEATDVLYRNPWMPAKQRDAGDLKGKMKKVIIRRFQWMKTTYEARCRGEDSGASANTNRRNC